MTKRLITAAVLVTSAFLAAFFSVNSVVTEIDKAVAEIEKNDDIYLCAQNVLSWWEDNEKQFSLILKHTDADTADRLFVELEDAVTAKNETMLRITLAEIKAFLHVTAEGEKAKIENIF